jgi:vitamin K-dependent gamma-carboxylase
MTEARPFARKLVARLFEPVDGAGIAAFRILFGCTMLVASVRSLLNGWVRDFYVVPRFYFKYWGFAWLEPLSDGAMHSLFVLLALLSALIALGLFYRVAAAAFFLAFTYVELLDVTYYLNHYYLVSLLALLLCVIPAHRTWSLDARFRPGLGAARLPAWCTYLLRFQVGLVYVFAGLAKLQPDWLIHAQPLNIWLGSRTGTPLLGVLFTAPWTAHLMSWAGFLFDISIVVFLSLRRTRLPAYFVLLAFHGVTGAIFNIGMFPIIMSTSALVFFSPSWPRSILRLAPPAAAGDFSTALGARRRLGLALGIAWCAVHVALPLRQHLYAGDVLWHEQGMRFAWKVMVRQKTGSVTYRVRVPGSGREFHVSPDEYLTTSQAREMSAQPDMILQLAQHVARDFRLRGYGQVEVRADALASLNGRPRARLIDPDVDLASVRDGILPANYVLPAPDTEPPRLRPVAAR